MGVPLVLFAFVATVIGGMGSLLGAVVGGFAVGFVVIMLQAYLPADLRSFRDAFVFTFVIAGPAVPPVRPYPRPGAGRTRMRYRSCATRPCMRFAALMVAAACRCARSSPLIVGRRLGWAATRCR